MFRQLALAMSLAAVPALGHAANLTFDDASAFASAAGTLLVESFETATPSVRIAGVPVITSLLAVSSSVTPIGVQSGANAPSDGFGAFATDGVQYLSAYREGLGIGTLRFDLAAPTRAFGFDLTDIEVTGGLIGLKTDIGGFEGGVLLETVSGNVNNASRRFFGITQDDPFSTVFVTITGIDDAVGIDNIRIAAVPLPAPALLLGAGVAALAAARRRKQG
jgi:hypothetical protein